MTLIGTYAASFAARFKKAIAGGAAAAAIVVTSGVGTGGLDTFAYAILAAFFGGLAVAFAPANAPKA